MQPPSDPLEQRYGTFAAVLDELQRIRTLSSVLDGTRESIDRVLGAATLVTEAVESSRDNVRESLASTTSKAEALFDAQREAITRAQQVHDALEALAASLAATGLRSTLSQISTDHQARFDALDQHQEQIKGLILALEKSWLVQSHETSNQSRALAGQVQILEQLAHNSHSLLGHLAEGHRQHVQVQTERGDALHNVLLTHRAALERLGNGVGGIASTLNAANLAERIEGLSRVVSTMQSDAAAFHKKSESRANSTRLLVIYTLVFCVVVLIVSLGLLRLQMTS